MVHGLDISQFDIAPGYATYDVAIAFGHDQAYFIIVSVPDLS